MLDVMALGFEPREKWFGYKRKAGISRPVREAYERSGMSLCMQRSKTIHVGQPICTGLRFLIASLCFFLVFLRFELMDFQEILNSPFFAVTVAG